jgi:hypothetical protein
MLDGIGKEIDICKSKLRKINSTEGELMLNVEKLFQKTIAQLEDPSLNHSLGIRSEMPKVSVLHHRLTMPFKPIGLPQDIEFPPKDKLSYDNHIVGVLDAQ